MKIITGEQGGLLTQEQLDDVAIDMRRVAAAEKARREPPFPTEKIEHGTVKGWIAWLREHGEALRGATNGAVVDYWKAVFLPWLSGRSAEQRASYISQLGFAKEWAEEGFPQVVIGDRLFASFAATNIPAEEAPELGLPWSCFIVRVPERYMVPIDIAHTTVDRGGAAVGPEKSRDRIGYIRVRRNWMVGEPAPSLAAHWGGTQNGYEFAVVPERHPWASGPVAFRNLAELLTPREMMVADRMRDGTMVRAPLDADEEFKGQTQRITGAMRRMFAGCVVEMMSPKSHAGGSGDSSRKRKMDRPTTSATTVLRREVVVDCRDWLTSYMSHETDRTLTVQTLVRGHWKRQPCGPASSERRYVHIEPYWRGPEGAPIAVRSHVMKGTGT